MRRRLTRLLLLALAGVVFWPATASRGDTIEKVYLALRYDLDRPDANPFFCKSLGEGGTLGPKWGQVPGRVITSGSSTTVTEAVTGEGPFRDLAVGDVLKVCRVLGTGTVCDIVAITAKASSASITVDTAVNWQNGTAGQKAEFRKPSCGQTINDGWFSVGAYRDVTFIVQYQQGDFGGGLDWRVECRDSVEDANPSQVFPSTLGSYQNIASAGATVSSSNPLAMFEIWNECRVAILANTSDPSDAGAALDRVRVVALGRLVQ